MPNKIDSNIVGLAVAEEIPGSPGQLPGVVVNGISDESLAQWDVLSPNSYSDFGGDIQTVARSPINASRQRQKGTTTDLDASVGFNHDFLQFSLNKVLQSFFFAAIRSKADSQKVNATKVAITAVTATTFAAAGGLGEFKANNLVMSTGFAVPGNNKLSLLSAATGTTLTTTGLTVEANPPATARVQAVGVEFGAADIDVTLTGTALINLSATAADFTTHGLTVGEWVWLGGDIAGSRFANNVGFARIAVITPKLLSFDQTTFTGVAEVGTGKSIRLFYGNVLRNEKDPTLIKTRMVQFERSLGSDGIAPAAQTEYVKGAVGNELTLNMPTADKLAVDMTFVGLDVQHRTSTQGPKAGTRTEIVGEDAFNTSTDIYRVRLGVVDKLVINNPALFGYVEEASVTIGNGITALKALGILGGFDVTSGDFMAGGSITAYFTTVSAVAAVRQNKDCFYNVICAKENAGFVYDMPLIAIGGGRVNVEKDAAVKIPLENMAFENPNGYTLMYVNFPYLPTVAMPVQ